MVVCGYAVRPEDLPALQALGVKDSKVLSPARREALEGPLKALAAGFHLVEIQPAEMDRRNLNDLELEAFAACIQAINPSAVFVDAPVGPRGIPRFRHRLLEKIAPLAPELVAENRADARFPVVSAASILAKVLRDRRVEAFRAEYGEIGSGYPSDPKTKAFLARWMAKHGTPPPIARASWGTFDRLKQAKFPF